MVLRTLSLYIPYSFMIYDGEEKKVWRSVDVGVLFPWFSSRSRRHNGRRSDIRDDVFLTIHYSSLHL